MSGWERTQYTYIWVFNVGRGLAIFVRLPQNIGIIYDLGSSEDFSPRKFIEKNIIPKINKFTDINGYKRRIAQLIISHPHTDHISEISSTETNQQEENFIDAGLVTSPHKKDYPSDIAYKYKDEKADFDRIAKTNQKSQAWLVDKYLKSIEKRKLPLQTIGAKNVSIPNVEYGIYYVRPPACNKLHEKDDLKYSNSVSIVFYYRHGNQNIVIPGDITPEAFEKVLSCDADVERRYTNFNSDYDSDDSKINTGTQAKLKDLLTKYGLTIFVPSHHGLESGYCPKLYNYIQGGKPRLNVISEKRHVGEKAGSIHQAYQNSDGVKGVEVDIEGKKETRCLVSTRQGHILIVFKGSDIKPHVYLRNKPEDLLSIVP